MSRRRNLVIGWPLALAVIAAFCRLGIWQYDRMHEKQAMLDAVQTVVQERILRPLSLAADPARARDYDWAGGKGHFVDAPAVLLDNQQRDERVGVRAYRVFQPDEAQAAPLLVELGWLPLPGDRHLPDAARPPGELRIEGLLSPPPSHGIMVSVATRQADGTLLATGLDAAGLHADLKQPQLAPRTLRLDPKAPLGYARDLDVLPNTLTPQRHLGYAVQWFALAAAVLATVLLLTFRKPKSRATESTP